MGTIKKACVRNDSRHGTSALINGGLSYHDHGRHKLIRV